MNSIGAAALVEVPLEPLGAPADRAHASPDSTNRPKHNMNAPWQGEGTRAPPQNRREGNSRRRCSKGRSWALGRPRIQQLEAESDRNGIPSDIRVSSDSPVNAETPVIQELSRIRSFAPTRADKTPCESHAERSNRESRENGYYLAQVICPTIGGRAPQVVEPGRPTEWLRRCDDPPPAPAGFGIPYRPTFVAAHGARPNTLQGLALATG